MRTPGKEYVCGHCTQGTHTWCINRNKQRNWIRNLCYLTCECRCN